MTDPLEYSFERVLADLFTEKSAWYLAFACRLTGWLEIHFFPRITRSAEIITILRSLFHRFGSPKEISLDKATNINSGEILSFRDSLCSPASLIR